MATWTVKPRWDKDEFSFLKTSMFDKMANKLVSHEIVELCPNFSIEFS